MLQLVKQAELAESGSSVSLADANRLLTTDVRFPPDPQTAAEKLYGWSIFVDLFHGSITAIATRVRNFVIAAGPALHRLHSFNLDNPALGMDLVCRVLFDAQQDYFSWANKVAGAVNLAAANLVPLPNFERLEDLIVTQRAESLSPLPGPWYSLFGGPAVQRQNRSEGAESSTRLQSGTASTFNAHADSRLMRRFKDSSFQSVAVMMEGKDVTVPQVRNKDVCLVWALKGKCSASCKRKAQHTEYPRSVITSLHQLMDQCGVAHDN
jgi:hypothetical protein